MKPPPSSVLLNVHQLTFLSFILWSDVHRHSGLKFIPQPVILVKDLLGSLILFMSFPNHT